MGKRIAKVALTAQERATLEAVVSKGRHAVRKVKRVQILLHLDNGKPHKAIAEAVGVSLATVYNLHAAF